MRIHTRIFKVLNQWLFYTIYHSCFATDLMILKDFQVISKSVDFQMVGNFESKRKNLHNPQISDFLYYLSQLFFATDLMILKYFHCHF